MSNQSNLSKRVVHRAVPRQASAPQSEKATRDVVPLSDLLARWVADGIVTPEQAQRMTGPQAVDLTPAEARHPVGPSLAVEALGYLGGVIMVVASVSIVGLYWEDLTTAVRLLLVGAVAVLLFGAGLLVGPRLGEAATRIRAVVWAGTTIAVAGFVALLAADVLEWEDDYVALTSAAGAAAAAAALWRMSRVFLQQLVFFVALMVAAAMAVLTWTDVDSLPGLGAWGVAVVWFLLAWGGLVPSRQLALPFASVAAIVTAITTFPTDAGILLALVTAGAVIGLAVLFHNLPMVAIGSLGLLQMLPMVITEWFPDAVAAPFVLLVVGVLVLALAVWSALRGRGEPVPESVKDRSEGTPAAAATAAAGVAVAVTVAVVVIALV